LLSGYRKCFRQAQPHRGGSGGFHLDGIGEQGIKKVVENAERLAEKICASLKKMKL